jgi:hypothetical protein
VSAGDWSVRDATVADRDGALALLHRVFGSNAAWLTPEAWEWLFVRNPDAGGLHYGVAEADGRIVAQYAAVPTRFQVAGAPRICMHAMLNAVEHGYRGSGAFRAVRAQAWASYDGAALSYGFPNARSVGIHRGAFDHRSLEPFPLLALPLPRVLATVRPRRRAGVEVGPLAGFGGWADDLWRAWAPTLGTAAVRDARFLDWRLAEAPRRYVLLEARVDGTTAGFAAVSRGRVRGRDVAYLLELLAFPDEPRAVGALLDAAVRAAAAARARLLLMFATRRHPHRRELLRAGFLPVPPPLIRSFNVGYCAVDEALPEAGLAAIDDWHLTPADLDYV